MSRTLRLGAFIVVTLAILAIGIFIIGSKQYLFSSTYRLRAKFANVVGLDVGADVRVGGVHRGTVQDIDLPRRPGDQVTVVMTMDSSTHEILKKDSVASIETEGLLGNEFMAISFGSTAAAELKDGDAIASQQPLAMSDLLKKTNGILDSTQDALKNVTQATASLSSITGKVDNGKGTVGALINDRTLYTNLNQTMNGMHDTMALAQAGVTDFQENMEALKHSFFVRGYFKNRGYEDSAELAKDEIKLLPLGTPLKTFTYQSKQIFVKVDAAKMKNEKSLGPAGDFLASNDFGLAVVVASSSMEGDTGKNLLLAQGRALVVREYLAENFGFDDSKLKTQAVGKKTGTSAETGWGTIAIVIYPAGTEAPAEKQPQAVVSSTTAPDRPTRENPALAAPKPD